MRSLALAAFVLSAVPALACINAYGTDLQGKRVEVDFVVGEDLTNYLTQESDISWIGAKARLLAKGSRATIYERNDLAAALLHVGEVRDAIDLLTQIEREKPGLYATATNLGTAYELAGDNARALQWIREGIKRNINSHEASEWLHVLILETKLNLAKDPKWLEHHSILAMGFGSALIPNPPSRFPNGNDGKPLTAAGVKNAIFNQMEERLQFVKPPEPIVGDILFDYANLLMRTDAIESAEAMYELAIRYGAPRAALAKQRRAYIQKLLANAPDHGRARR